MAIWIKAKAFWQGLLLLIVSNRKGSHQALNSMSENHRWQNCHSVCRTKKKIGQSSLMALALMVFIHECKSRKQEVCSSTHCSVYSCSANNWKWRSIICCDIFCRINPQKNISCRFVIYSIIIIFIALSCHFQINRALSPLSAFVRAKHSMSSLFLLISWFQNLTKFTMWVYWLLWWWWFSWWNNVLTYICWHRKMKCSFVAFLVMANEFYIQV